MKVKKSVMLLLLAFLAWCPPLYMSRWIIVVLRVLVFIFSFNNLNVRKLSNESIAKFIFAFSFIQGLSILNNSYDMKSCIINMSYVLVLPSIYLMLANENMLKSYNFVILIASCIYFLIDAYFAFFTKNGTGLNANNQPLYFSGGKFQICYIYMVFLCALLLKKKYKIIAKILLTVFGMVVAYTVNCNTGLIAILLFGIVQLIPTTFYTRKRVYIWLATLIFLNYSIVILQIQTKYLFISNLITNILHRDLGFTGRMRIYNDIAGIMSNHLLLGYGYGNDFVTQYTSIGGLYGLANMQNGFLQILYVSGIIGMLIYIIILIFVFHGLQLITDERKKVVLLGSLTAFLLAAIVEIPFSSGAFNILLGLIFCENKIRQRIK